MNPINQTTTTTGGQNVYQQPKSELNMETFLMLLTVQLANQNPLEPMNDRDFFAQMAQLGQVEGLGKLQDTMDFGQAASLIGKTVKAVRPGDATGVTTVEGEIVSVSIRNGEQVIAIQEKDGGLVEVTMKAIQSVSK